MVAVYAEHFFEHLSEKEADVFLREALRSLTPGGIMRLVVPDAGRYLKLYAAEHWEAIAAIRPLTRVDDGWRDAFSMNTYQTPMQFINAVFRQGTQHKYAYDAETLIATMQRAGFADVRQMSYGVSSDPAMTPDTPNRASESLYVEGVKP